MCANPLECFRACVSTGETLGRVGAGCLRGITSAMRAAFGCIATGFSWTISAISFCFVCITCGCCDFRDSARRVRAAAREAPELAYDDIEAVEPDYRRQYPPLMLVIDRPSCKG